MWKRLRPKKKHKTTEQGKQDGRRERAVNVQIVKIENKFEHRDFFFTCAQKQYLHRTAYATDREKPTSNNIFSYESETEVNDAGHGIKNTAINATRKNLNLPKIFFLQSVQENLNTS